MSADVVLTGMGPVLELDDSSVKWTLSDMGSSFPVLRPVPAATGAGLLLTKKAPRDGVPIGLWLGGGDLKPPLPPIF